MRIRMSCVFLITRYCDNEIDVSPIVVTTLTVVGYFMLSLCYKKRHAFVIT